MWLIFVFSFSLPSLSCIIGCGQIQIAVVAATKYPTPSAGGRKFNNLVFLLLLLLLPRIFGIWHTKKFNFLYYFQHFLCPYLLNNRLLLCIRFSLDARLNGEFCSKSR